jgi:hypothetical protein
MLAEIIDGSLKLMREELCSKTCVLIFRSVAPDQSNVEYMVVHIIDGTVRPLSSTPEFCYVSHLYSII